MNETPDADDQISEETRLMVTRVRERAAEAPGAGEIADLLASAGTGRTAGMSAEQIRGVARDALRHAEQVSFLLGKLAGLLDDDAEGGP